MKYKTNKIIEDTKLMEGKSLSEMRKLTGHQISYLSRVKSGKLIVTEKKYLDLKAKLGY